MQENYKFYEIDEEIKIEFDLLCEKICKIFPDYKNDESFGGKKKYIKISIINDKYNVSYIIPDLIEKLHEDISFNNYIDRYEINKNVADELQYFNNIINKNLRVEKIYDINSIEFITKINKTKLNIKIENYEGFKSHLPKYRFYGEIEKITNLFQCNIIINDCLYSTLVKEDDDIFKKFENLKDFDDFRLDVGIQNYKIIKLYKINSKYYDYETFLRKYTPYVIRWDINNNYYIVNRDYEYIRLNTKSMDYVGQAYLFNDGNKPWNNKKYYIRFLKEYKKIINNNFLKKCLNMHNSVKIILKLLN